MSFPTSLWPWSCTTPASPKFPPDSLTPASTEADAGGFETATQRTARPRGESRPLVGVTASSGWGSRPQ